MSNERNVCAHCGAKQKASASVCDLCGSPLSSDPVDKEIDAAGVDEEVAALAAVEELEQRDGGGGSSDTEDRGGFCTSCGNAYPAGARFCGACGRKIAAADSEVGKAAAAESAVSVTAAIPTPEAPPSKRAATDKELGRQVLLVVGAAVVLIVALFVITVVSRDDGVSEPASESGQTATALPVGPLAPEVEGTVQSLRDEIESLTGEARTLKNRELADFLISHGRWDLAAEVQEEIARVTGAESDWVRTGNLYYDWMEGVSDDDVKAAFAQRAIAAYQQALQINPDNLDVRTDMAIAYMFDPGNSVQAIAQTNMVLEQDSMHVQANFNRGIMLLRINRFDEAIGQFNTVKRIVADPANPIYQRAESALDALRQVNSSD